MFKLKNIIVPTDFSKVSYSAFEYARDLAEMMEATIHLIYVLEKNLPFMSKNDSDLSSEDLMKSIGEEKQRKLKEIVDDIKDDSSIKIIEIMRQGVDYEEIVKYQEEVKGDIIVIATHGRTGVFHKILGSVAEKVIRYAKCPVLVISPQEEEL
jgi:nucleotide-binding universal stress UspA family protein